MVEQKTAGNPFFAIQFISALFEEGLLVFDHIEGQWCWDLDRIHAKGYTDNVVDLMVGKSNRLPTETQRALQQLACLGNSADFAMLRTVSQDPSEEMHDSFGKQSERVSFSDRKIPTGSSMIVCRKPHTL